MSQIGSRQHAEAIIASTEARARELYGEPLARALERFFRGAEGYTRRQAYEAAKAYVGKGAREEVEMDWDYFYAHDGEALYRKLAAETAEDFRGRVTDVEKLFDEYAAGPLVVLVMKAANMSEAQALDVVYANAGDEVYGHRREAMNIAYRGGSTREILQHVSEAHDAATRIAKVISTVTKSATADPAKAIHAALHPRFPFPR